MITFEHLNDMLKNLFQILLTLEIAYLLSAVKDEDLAHLNQYSFLWPSNCFLSSSLKVNIAYLTENWFCSRC